MMILIGLYALVGTGLTMLMGYAGQISLGHAAFYGIGAYSTAIITGTYGLPSVIGIIVGFDHCRDYCLYHRSPDIKIEGKLFSPCYIRVWDYYFHFF